MNLRKFIFTSLTLLFVVLFAGSMNAQTTYYVDNQVGNNANSGLAGSPVQDVAHALAAAPAGSVISINKTPIDYTDGNITIVGSFTLTSTNGTPVFTSAQLIVGTGILAANKGTVTIGGPLQFNGGLTLQNGTLAGGNNLTVKGTVTRTDIGSITSGQLNYAAATNFVYDNTNTTAIATITTGLELPVDATNLNNLTTTKTGGFALTLKFDQNRTVNGAMTFSDGANLNGTTITVNGAAAHTFTADVTGGNFAFVLPKAGGTATLNGAAKVGNVTVGDVAVSGLTAGNVVIGGITPPTLLGNLTVNNSATATATIAGAGAAVNAGNVTLNGTGNVNLTVTATGKVGDVLAASTSTGTVTLNTIAAGAITVNSLTLSGTGAITFGATANAATVTNAVLLNTVMPAFPAKGTAGASTITGLALITFPAGLVNVTTGAVTNSVAFSGTGDQTGNSNNGLISFLNIGTLTTGAVTNSVSGTVAWATTPAGSGTNNGNILLNSGAGLAVSLGDVVNNSTITAPNNTFGTIASVSAYSAAFGTKNITNSSLSNGNALNNNIDFSSVTGTVTVTGSVYETGATVGGFIKLGSANVSVSVDIKSDRGVAGSDITVGGGAGTLSAKNISNTGKSKIISVGSGNVALSGGLTSASGSITFTNLTGTFSQKTITVSGGLVDFGVLGGNVSATQTVSFTGGTVYFGTGARNFTMTGANIQIGAATTKTTFAATSAIVPTGTTMVFDQPIPNVVQTISLGLVETQWPGNLTVSNPASIPAPYVVFKSVDAANPGVLRILGGLVTFNTSASSVYNTVQIDNARLYVGLYNASGTSYNGNFDNVTGYVTANGGFVSMAGGLAGAQVVNAVAPADPSVQFGNFGVDNYGGTSPCVTFSNTATVAGDFYLATGAVSNVNLVFNGSPYPTIYRTSGSFIGAPTFTSMVNVTYYGYDKATSFEVPTATDKLNNLTVATSNGAKAGYGIVALAGAATVNGVLTINANQALYTGANNLILNGPSVVINGILADNGTTQVQLKTATGIAFTGTGILPAIQVNDGSKGNSITGYTALYSNYLPGGVYPVNAGLPQGDIFYQPNTGTNTSSLSVSFTGAGPHFNNLTVDVAGTFSLLADATMKGNVTLVGGTIALGDFALNVQNVGATNFAINGTTANASAITSTSKGVLVLKTTANAFNVTVNPVTIAANVTFTGGFTYSLLAASQDLTLAGNVTLTDNSTPTGATVDVQAGRTLTLGGTTVSVSKNSVFAATGGTGVVYLANVAPATLVTLSLNNAAVAITNLTVDGAAALTSSATTTLTVTNLLHKSGLFNIDGVIVQVGTGGAASFTRTGGTYSGDSYLIWNGTPATAFLHSNAAAAGDMTINSLQVNTALNLQNNAALNVVKNLYLKANLDNSFAGAGASLVTVGNATTVPTVKINGVSTVTTNALSFGNANSDFSFEGASLTVDKMYWPLTATLARNVTVNMTAQANIVTLGLSSAANNAINGNITLTKGVLGWDGGLALTVGSGSTISRTELGNLNKNVTALATAGTLVAPSVNLVYIPSTGGTASVAVAILTQGAAGTGTGIEYSDPTEVKNFTLGAAGNKAGATLTVLTARTIAGLLAVIDGTDNAAGSTSPSILTFAQNTTLSAAQNLTSGSIVIAAGKTLTLSNTAASTLTGVAGGTIVAAGPLTVGASTSNITSAGALTLNGAYAGATISASGDVLVGPNGALGAASTLSFVGANDATITVPAAGAAITNLTINKSAVTNQVKLAGGNLATTGLLTLTKGLFLTNAFTLNINQPLFAAGGQGFTAAAGSYVVGNVAKNSLNTAVLATSSNSRFEFPVGSLTQYRPVALTFNPGFGVPTNPNGYSFLVAAAADDANPGGTSALPIKDGVMQGVDIGRYPNLYWTISSSPSSVTSSTAFDLELRATGFTAYDTQDNVRIIRRHGVVADITNPWLLQGTNDSYDNSVNNGVLTVIQRGAGGGLRSGGAIFTLGLRSGLKIATPIPTQYLVIKDGAKQLALGNLFSAVDGSAVTFTFGVNNSDATVATTSLIGANLRITPLKIGNTVVTVLGKNVANNDNIAFDIMVNVSTVGVETEEIPTEFSLSQNYPNPFNPTTNIKFGLPKESNVTLRVFNILGEEVATLVNKVMPAGFHTVNFDATRFASGMYIYRIESDNFVQVKKMLLMK